MNSRALAVTVLILLACCCCCSGRNRDTGPSPTTQEAIAAFAYAPATVAARASANRYAESLLASVRHELPSLVVVHTGVQDRCYVSVCDLAVDYFFGMDLSGTDSDPLASLARIDAVLRRASTNASAGVDSVPAGGTACAELHYELPRPQGTADVPDDLTGRARPWTSNLLWVDTAASASVCATRLPAATAVSSGPVYRVRDEDVDMGALLAGVLGQHRFIVRIGVAGSYLTRQ